MKNKTKIYNKMMVKMNGVIKIHNKINGRINKTSKKIKKNKVKK